MSLKAAGNLASWDVMPSYLRGLAFLLADYTNAGTGLCCPSVSTLARRTMATERTVQRNLAELESLGVIRRQFRYVEGRQTTTQYELLPPPAERCVPVHPDAGVGEEGDMGVRGEGDVSVTHEGDMGVRGVDDVSVTQNQEVRNQEVGTRKEGKEKEAKASLSGRSPTRVSREDVARVLSHLNERAGRQFKLISNDGKETASARLVRARIKEHGVDALLAMIDRKVDKWLHDDKMYEFLRPETLFNKTKCESYLGEATSTRQARALGEF